MAPNVILEESGPALRAASVRERLRQRGLVG